MQWNPEDNAFGSHRLKGVLKKCFLSAKACFFDFLKYEFHCGSRT